MKIRREMPSDFETIDHVVIEAFKNAEHTDGHEHRLIKRLRASSSYVPELALIAEIDGAVVGHVLFSRILIRRSGGGGDLESLALAPVSVHPGFQGQGVGAALIREGHKIARAMGFTSVILLGHPSYYPRFGYGAASKWGIRAPFDVPDEAFMA